MENLEQRVLAEFNGPWLRVDMFIPQISIFGKDVKGWEKINLGKESSGEKLGQPLPPLLRVFLYTLPHTFTHTSGMGAERRLCPAQGCGNRVQPALLKP